MYLALFHFTGHPIESTIRCPKNNLTLKKELVAAGPDAIRQVLYKNI